MPLSFPGRMRDSVHPIHGEICRSTSHPNTDGVYRKTKHILAVTGEVWYSGRADRARCQRAAELLLAIVVSVDLSSVAENSDLLNGSESMRDRSPQVLADLIGGEKLCAKSRVDAQSRQYFFLEPAHSMFPVNAE